MFERRRPILGLLIGLTFCISIWRISVQEPSMYTNEFGYGNQLTYDDHDHRPSPTAYELKHTQPVPAAAVEILNHHFQQHRTNQGRYSSNEAGHHQTTPLNLNNNNNNYDTASSNNLSLVSFTPSSAPASSSSMVFDYESLPADDFTTLIDFKDFKFLINQAPCARTNTAYFLILVHSAPSNYQKRQVIRETWGSVQSPHLRLLFLVGGVQTSQLQKTLDAENAKFSDLIQGNFVDDYRNMTYKHVMALKWFIYLCPKAKFLIKTDDDVFVNTLQLLEYVELQRQHRPPIQSLFTPRTYHVPNSSSTHNTSHILNVLQSTNFLFCQRQAEARVKRSYRSKWRVSTKEYAGRYYPPYCPGYSIMYSPDVVFRLYKEAQRSKYFWIDDVHITGTLAQNSNITITSFWPWRMHPKVYDYILNGKTDIGQYLFFFAWANISERQIRDLWAMTFGHFNSTRSNDDGGVGGVGAYKYDSFR